MQKKSYTINNVDEHFVAIAVMLNQQSRSLLIDDRRAWFYTANTPKGGTSRVGAVRDYCLFIRGLSFGEFSGCAYLRNDGNPLSLFFYTLPPRARLASTQKGGTRRRYVRVVALFTIVRLSCDEDRLCAKKKKKEQKKKKQKVERKFE